MHPVLFKIGWFELHPFGLLLVLSFILGIILSLKRAKKTGVDQNIILDFAVVVCISGIIGARLMYTIFHLDEFKGHYLDIINPIQSSGAVGIYGMTVLGGIILASVSGVIYLQFKNVSKLSVFNVIAPSVALGFAITIIGCFLQGCCFGTPCLHSWGVTFPENSPGGFIFPNQALHPTQLYASFGGLINFLLLLYLERYTVVKNKTFFLFLIFYGVSRFIEDIFRYYEESMMLFHNDVVSVSVNQGISAVLILTGIYGIFYISLRKYKQI
jgi:phosphatidylglycerol:prolipoprotein diacylglycerol transferase